jgi:hypothetical protein
MKILGSLICILTGKNIDSQSFKEGLGHAVVT